MYQLKKEEMYKIAPLFEGYHDTLIWSCLQGYMGRAWIDEEDFPTSAQVITGDFCFYAGRPKLELVMNIPEDYPSDYLLVIPPDSEWANLLEQVYKEGCHKFMRYSIKKETDIFDKDKLRSYIEVLPAEYNIRRIEEDLYHQIMQEKWSKDLCSQFPTYQDYDNLGLGYVTLYQGMVVCGASSYTVYDKGIEIEIDTKEEYRRRGLALACASALILECLNRGMYPSWDAANKASVALAEKLGYHFDKEYVTYAVLTKTI